MKNILILLFISFTSTAVFSSEGDDEMLNLAHNFISTYKSLNIAQFKFSYVENFNQIQDLDGLKKQEDVFHKLQNDLNDIDVKSLTTEVQYIWRTLQFEAKTNLERIELEKDYREKGYSVHTDGLYKIQNHEAWYRYYLKMSASSSITPEQVAALGESEIKRIKSEIKKIQKQVGFEGKNADFFDHLNSSDFLLSDKSEVLKRYDTIKNLAYNNLGNLFSDTDIPEVQIEAIPNVHKDSPPGYYNEGTFYFNFFQGVSNTRSYEWLFIHEAIPGHHYQMSLKKYSLVVPEIQDLFYYSGFAEGWGAYTENLGKELGFYADPYSYLGKCEWDLVRSARLVMDVGINYYGWSKDKALEYWKENIPNQDGIAVREIDRMIRWPGQVVSYKVGEAKILELRRLAEKNSNFDLKQFHREILRHGTVPLDVLQ